jgi:hypothetical protein
VVVVAVDFGVEVLVVADSEAVDSAVEAEVFE